MLNILTYTSLYPNAAQPHHGIFVENRLRHLARCGEAQITVVAPVPFFPLRAKFFGRYADYARAPRREIRHGLNVHHPRYPVIPKIGMSIAPRLMAAGTRSLMARLAADGTRFDLLDAHYFYPDGVAAAVLAERLELPLVVTARGSDISEIATYDSPRRQILWAARRARVVVTVCDALRAALIELGVDRDRIEVIRNGVDLELFEYRNPSEVRGRLDWFGPLLLSVGHLIPRKGHDLVIRALSEIEGARLAIIGEGPEGPRLKSLAARLGLAERVYFVGRVPHQELANFYSAADLLVLASSREGWANVLLEALACGTPVVATDVWGTKEAVCEPIAGELVGERSPQAIARAIKRALRKPADRETVRAYAEGFSWRETTDRQLALFSAIADRRR